MLEYRLFDGGREREWRTLGSIDDLRKRFDFILNNGDTLRRWFVQLRGKPVDAIDLDGDLGDTDDEFGGDGGFMVVFNGRTYDLYDSRDVGGNYSDGVGDWVGHVEDLGSVVKYVEERYL